MDTDDASPSAAAQAPAVPAARPRPSWYLRWGKPSAFWLCGFAVGAAVVYGAIWGKEQYEAHQTLQALHLPPPVTDNAVATLFTPTPAAAPAAAALPPVPEAKAEPPAAVVMAAKPVRVNPAKIQRPARATFAKAPVRKPTAAARQPVRLSARRPAPRVLEIRRGTAAADRRATCRRGDLVRDCYIVR